MSPAERSQWIERDGEVPLAMQCELAGVPRSSAYRRLEAAVRTQCESEQDLKLRELIDEQYTNRPFYGSRRMRVFLKKCGHIVITISMDGRGRALDNIFVERLWRNVKYEDVYLKGYANMAELTVGLVQYFAFYNAERPHQALGYQTPRHVYSTGVGGGALIVDRFGDDDGEVQEKSNTGQRRAADEIEMGTA